MKLERISENQIRCTLNKSDLADKQLLITELAYGTDKAKELFRELMQQASEELGFEVDNIPLMIEAIPVSPECLVLIITKVEDPEELDTRFSRFTKPISDSEEIEEEEDEEDEEIEEELPFVPFSESVSQSGFKKSGLGSLIEKLGGIAGEIISNAPQPAGANTGETKTELSSKDTIRVFAFKNLDELVISAKIVDKVYKSDNSLFKNPQDSRFYLYMTKNNNTDAEFAKCCNMVGEYGKKVKTTYSTKTYMEEHYKIIIDCNALQTLAKL